MTEYSHFWGGDHIGDIASDWRVSDDDFAKMLRSVFGLGATYTSSFTGYLPAGYSLKFMGGVIKRAAYGAYADCFVSNIGLAIRIEAGSASFAVVDGRLYYATSVYGVGTAVAPGTGLNYYIVGLRALKSTQQVRGYLIGPETDPANLVQPFTPGTDLVEPLACVTVDPVSTVTIYDVRRFLRPQGYQIPILVRRKGSSGVDEWDEAGSASIVMDSEVGMMFGCVQQTATASNGYCTVYLGDVFKHALAFATFAGTDAKVMTACKYYQTSLESHFLNIGWRVHDGTNVTNPVFHFKVIGELNADWHATHHPWITYTRTVQAE